MFRRWKNTLGDIALLVFYGCVIIALVSLTSLLLVSIYHWIVPTSGV